MPAVSVSECVMGELQAQPTLRHEQMPDGHAASGCYAATPVSQVCELVARKRPFSPACEHFKEVHQDSSSKMLSPRAATSPCILRLRRRWQSGPARRSAAAQPHPAEGPRQLSEGGSYPHAGSRQAQCNSA